jgi:hypothetical protein
MQTAVGLFIVLVIALSMGLQFSTFKREGFKIKAKANLKTKPKLQETMTNMNPFDSVPKHY